ncbi:MAG: hypothetical protein HY865_16285 [Chloroflexi bacterium]|nr:hypothetical protein [Chloroflexota bacterium]
MYVSGFDSPIAVCASGKVQAGGCWGFGVDVMVGTLVTVGGSGVKVAVGVSIAGGMTCPQAVSSARRMIQK